MFPVRVYQVTLAWALGGHCRFTPSCSHYALEAIEKHGILKGWTLAMWRLMRCQPLCKGGHDPVPPVAPKPGTVVNSPKSQSSKKENDERPDAHSLKNQFHVRTEKFDAITVVGVAVAIAVILFGNMYFSKQRAIEKERLEPLRPKSGCASLRQNPLKRPIPPSLPVLKKIRSKPTRRPSPCRSRSKKPAGPGRCHRKGRQAGSRPHRPRRDP